MEVAPAYSPGVTNPMWATKVASKNSTTATYDDIMASTKHQTGNENDDKTDSAESLPPKDGHNGIEELKNHIAQFLTTMREQKNCMEKLIFVTSLTCLMVVSYGIVAFPCILPYFYTGATPFLIGLRIWLYVGKKWQLFLVDFCYFANLLLFIYLWACPGTEQVFCAVFAVANGPLLFAIITYRNTLAFHSLDRMTSVFIHILPALLTFSIRWQPSAMPWYTDFARIDLSTADRLPWEWLVAVPYGFYVLHTITYYTVVYICIKPDEQYWDTYRYMTGNSGGMISKLLNIFGPKFKPAVFVTLNWLYTLMTFLISVLWFNYFFAHCVFLVLIGLVLIWNGASFYLDVFSEKGLDAEPYRFCVK